MVKFIEKTILQKMFLIMLAAATFGANANENSSDGFVSGITIPVDHDTYYFAGPPVGSSGATDVPGHKWLRIGKNRYLGQHFNTGPGGAPNYWSSDAGDGALLYVMDAIIDTWSEAKSFLYYTKGFVHYHVLINTDGTGARHPTKVVWFKHVAVKSFTFDGEGPLAFGGIEAYDVVPGVDYKIAPNNWNVPYDPNPAL